MQPEKQFQGAVMQSPNSSDIDVPLLSIITKFLAET